MVLYFGMFFDKSASKIIYENEKVHLENLPNNFHCTFEFAPKEYNLLNEVIGKEVSVTLVGYACNGKNSGFEIEIPENIKMYFKNFDNTGKLKIPHITTSISKEGKAVDTANLYFEELDEPIIIKGKFGYFIKDRNKSYISFNKVETNECNK